MRKMKFQIFIAFSFVAIARASTFSPELGIMGGYSALSELVFFTDDISIYGLGLKNGVNVGAKAALNFFSFGLNAKYRYYQFGAQGHCDGVIEGHHSMTIPHQVEANFKIKALSIGAEWKIFSYKRIKPFIYFDYFLDCDANTKILKEPNNKNLPPPYENVRTDFSFNENNRTGTALGAGIQIIISPQMMTGITIEHAKFQNNRSDYSLSSIYSFVLPQKNISITSMNVILSYAF